MDIRGFTVHELWIEEASEIASEHYASIILDRSEKKLLAIVTAQGGMDVEEVAEADPAARGQAPHRAECRIRPASTPVRSSPTPGSPTTSASRSPTC